MLHVMLSPCITTILTTFHSTDHHLHVRRILNILLIHFNYSFVYLFSWQFLESVNHLVPGGGAVDLNTVVLVGCLNKKTGVPKDTLDSLLSSWIEKVRRSSVNFIIDLSQVGTEKGIRPMKINKNGIYIISCRLTSGNRPTLPRCGREDVVTCGLRSRDV